MDTLILILKILSQGLILLGGLWAIFGAAGEGAAGARRPGPRGWIKLALLVVGFGLFGLSELQARKQAEARAAREAEARALQQRTIDNQATQLEHLRRLLLTQHQISHLEIALLYDPGALEPFYEAIRTHEGARAAPPPDPTVLAYLSTACRNANVTVTRLPDDSRRLRYTINRPQGFVDGRVAEGEPEWRAFETALAGLLSERFDILADNGRVLVSLTGAPAPRWIRCRENGLAFVFRNTGVRFDEIAETRLRFELAKPERHQVPARVRFTSKDPRVAWDQAIATPWVKEVIASYYVVETDETGHVHELRSGPHAVEARLVALGAGAAAGTARAAGQGEPGGQASDR